MSKPNRYFQAFVEVRMPWCTHKAWGPYASEIVLFEQPDMPAYDDIVRAVKRACPAAIGASSLKPLATVKTPL